jgi:hypothetical protein
MIFASNKPLRCPRCRNRLLERESTRKWKAFFECVGCCLAFELVIERHRAPCGHNPKAWFIRHTTKLQPGRTKRSREAPFPWP